jgi:parvulin-like peptidyl-prolyl isomerase
MKERREIWVVFLVVLLVCGCSDKSETVVEHQPLIQVDGRVLTLAEFNEFFEPIRMSYTKGQINSAAGIREARLRFLLQLLEEMIVLRRAEELHLSISPEEMQEAVGGIERDYGDGSFETIFIKQAISSETWHERLKRQLLVEKVVREELLEGISVTPEEISQYYDEHREEWTRGEQVSAQHILLPSKELAERVLAQVKKGEDFATLAREHSEAPESEKGGDMGFVVRGQLPKFLEDPLFALPLGKVSTVIKTPYGYHIFKVVERRRAGETKIDDWIDKIRDRIQKQKLHASYGPWLAELRSRYTIAVNEELI